MVTHSGAGRYALASIVRNWYTSYFERNFAANSAAVTRFLAEDDIYIAFDQMKLKLIVNLLQHTVIRYNPEDINCHVI